MRTSNLAVGLVCFLACAGGFAAEAAKVDFARDVAPILRSYCAGCHDDAHREGRLSVETYGSLRRGGEDHGDPVHVGRPDDSFLIRSLEGRERPTMPPKDEPRVPEAELATLRRWIAEGAVGPKPAKDLSILRELTVPRWPAGKGPVAYFSAAYGPEGRRMALGRFGEIEIWDVTHRSLVRRVRGLPGKVTALNFDREGARLLAATGTAGLDGVAWVLDVASGTRLLELTGHGDMLYDAEFSPDGKRVATAGYDRTIRIWDSVTGALERTIDVHKGAVFDLAWHPSGKVLASASADETVKVWRVDDGARLDTLNQPQGEVRAVAFTPDGTHILAAGADKRIHLWRFVHADAPGLNPVVHSRFAHETPIHAIAVSSDGRYVVSSADDRTSKLWSLPDLRLIEARPAANDVAASIVAVPGSDRFLIARLDGSTEVVGVEVPMGSPSPQPAAAESAPGAASTAPAAEVAASVKSTELEPNDDAGRATAVQAPAEVSGSIGRPGDADCFRFVARAGVPVWVEVTAARTQSKLDSRIEVLHADGSPVEQVVLQAVRDSWFTFRGKDSDTSEDFRLHNWTEMELDEYFYANGEVVRLWLYPRGPDSGFKVYPGEGRRRTFFGSSALAHAMGEPGYIVAPWPAGTTPPPNGLPVFRLNYANDDDPERRAGADSVLKFVAPADGEYLVRVTDVRGFGGEGYPYVLAIRPPRPGFEVSVSPKDPKVSPGSGREIVFKAVRREGFEGAIRIDLASLPPGFDSSAPVEIEAGQTTAVGVVYAQVGAIDPGAEADGAVRITASAVVDGREVRQDLGGLGNLQVGPPPKVTISIHPAEERGGVGTDSEGPPVFTLRPGETLQARVRAVRHDFQGRIEFGNEDSGRNLPHGVYVDNIGLNGLLIVEGQSEREFFVTASKIARPGRRPFHLRARADDGQASRPVVLEILPAIAPDVAIAR